MLIILYKLSSIRKQNYKLENFNICWYHICYDRKGKGFEKNYGYKISISMYIIYARRLARELSREINAL